MIEKSRGIMGKLISNGSTLLTKEEIERIGLNHEMAEEPEEVEITINYFKIPAWRKTPIFLEGFLDDDHTRLLGRISGEDMLVVFYLEHDSDLVTVQIFDQREAPNLEPEPPEIDWLDD